MSDDLFEFYFTRDEGDNVDGGGDEKSDSYESNRTLIVLGTIGEENNCY
jgi:hypothetical protein